MSWPIGQSVSVVASSWKHFSPRFARKCHARRSIVIVDDAAHSYMGNARVWEAVGIQTDHPEALIQLLVNRK